MSLSMLRSMLSTSGPALSCRYRSFASLPRAKISLENESFKVISPSRVASQVLVTCEHASMRMPDGYRWPEEDKWIVGTHWSYDIGAEDFTRELSEAIYSKAILTNSTRLVLDPNREMGAETMFRASGDNKPIHLNQDLSGDEKRRRIERFYTPYHQQLKSLVDEINPRLLMSIHSFTPEYEGKKREVEIGVLYNHNESPARELMELLKAEGYDARLNEPWSGLEGFAYAVSNVEKPTRRAVMLEFRNDLCSDSAWRTRVIELIKRFLVNHAYINK